MKLTLRQRILNFLTVHRTPIKAEGIAHALGEKKQRVQEVLSGMKKRKRVIPHGKTPWSYTLNEGTDNNNDNDNNDEYGIEKLEEKLNKKLNKKFKKKLKALKKKAKKLLNEHMIMYFTKDSKKPKWLHEFENAEEVIAKYASLSTRKDIIEIAVYRKVECNAKTIAAPDIQG